MSYIQKAKNTLSKKIDVEDDLLDLYVLLVLTTGIYTKLRDVHDAWAVWKNKTMPEHRSLVPFDDLSKDVQELDREYTEAIAQTAQELIQEN